MPSAKRVLVVDDEPDIRNTLFHVFRQMGHDVDCAEDGFSALERIRVAQPDIILSDLNMPGMSGFELLSVVRRRLPGIYVIATSGAYSGAQIPRGIAADAFYEKASDFKTLLKVLAEAAGVEDPVERSSDEIPPMWISQENLEQLDGSELIVNCPECLRNSTPSCDDAPWKIHDTRCVYCNTEIRYAIIRTMDILSSQANRPGLDKVQAIEPQD